MDNELPVYLSWVKGNELPVYLSWVERNEYINITKITNKIVEFHFVHNHRLYSCKIANNRADSFVFKNVFHNGIWIDILELCGRSTDLGYVLKTIYRLNKNLKNPYGLYNLLLDIKPFTKYISIKSNAIKILINTTKPVFIQINYNKDIDEQINYIYKLFEQLTIVGCL